MDYTSEIFDLMQSMQRDLHEDEDLAHNSSISAVVAILEAAGRICHANVLFPDDAADLFVKLVDLRHDYDQPFEDVEHAWKQLEETANSTRDQMMDWAIFRLQTSRHMGDRHIWRQFIRPRQAASQSVVALPAAS